jgi:hypothetical protein
MFGGPPILARMDRASLTDRPRSRSREADMTRSRGQRFDPARLHQISDIGTTIDFSGRDVRHSCPPAPAGPSSCGYSIPASARDPMPITLRNVRPDAAAKLRQLESGAAALDRAARDLIPEELRHRLRPRRPLRVTIKARAYLRYLRPAGHAAESSLAALARTTPHIAAGFRVLRGLLADVLFCISLSGAVLVALALAIMLVAPPA